MTHPLTDEMCKQIQLHIFNQTDEDCLRAAWDLGAQACIDWLHNYPWRAMDLQGIAEDLEEQLLAHKELRSFSELTKDVSPERRERIEQRKTELRPQGVLQSDQTNKEDQ